MDHQTRFWRRPVARAISVAGLLATLLGTGAFVATHAAHADASTCQLQSARGNIQHVIYVQFDNTHFTRDNPNVPSDLEQMPHLLNFIESNGTLLSNYHTPLIAHTATDILTSFTGVYGDRHGVPISNSFRYFTPGTGASNTGVSFAYWTDPIFDPANPHPPIDPTYNMLAANGQNAPAPWVPYTRAGCNVGGVGTANMVLENIATDIPTVFGAGSPQASEVAANPTLATADFVGIGIHCAAGSALCAASNGGETDQLPQEPGGYTGYNGLFGAKYVNPQISPSGPMTDLNGHVIADPHGNKGFPGFDGMAATVSLSYVAAMQEHGVPVTYAYISDAHDNHPSGPAFGPGQAGYVAALKAYDDAFGAFFTRLASDGINSSNTLFVFTADEGDHFVGGAPSPANCDGVNIPCTYSQIGEINGNIAGMLATQAGITTPFKVHSDSAPNFYVTGNPGRTDGSVRAMERALGTLTATNPITGATDRVTNYLADPVEMDILHMVTADPLRTPTFTQFADPNYFFFAGAPNCGSPCVTEQPGFAWNHGDVSPDINTTWLGLVGPGVRNLGVDSSTWADQTDLRPTMMTLLGLKDDYGHDGRALVEDLDDWAVPQSWLAHRSTLLSLAQTYKQIDACVGDLGLTTLKISTTALESGSASDDTAYDRLENQLSQINTQRDALAGQMIALLEGATFDGQNINDGRARGLINQGQALLTVVHNLARA